MANKRLCLPIWVTVAYTFGIWRTEWRRPTDSHWTFPIERFEWSWTNFTLFSCFYFFCFKKWMKQNCTHIYRGKNCSMRKCNRICEPIKLLVHFLAMYDESLYLCVAHQANNGFAEAVCWGMRRECATQIRRYSICIKMLSDAQIVRIHWNGVPFFLHGNLWEEKKRSAASTQTKKNMIPLCPRKKGFENGFEMTIIRHKKKEAKSLWC